MTINKKIFKKEDIEICKDYVFGYTRFFKNYEIIDNDFDMYLIGKNQINKKSLFMSINKSEFLKECKKIGRDLCDILFKDLDKHSEIISTSYDDVVNINPYLISLKTVKKYRTEILKIISNFIHTYGIPINYELTYTLYTKTEITNSIGLRELCTYFILINIISDLAYCSRHGIKIDTYYNLFNLSKNETNEEIINMLFNINLLHDKHIGEYNIKYIDNHPVCFTPNIFTFAFEHLKYSIIKKKNNIDVRVEITHNKRKKPKSKKELSRNSSNNYFVNQRNDYNELIKYRNYIEKNDTGHEYTVLLNKLKNVKKIKDIKRTIHTPLIEEARHIFIRLKSDRN